MHGVHEADAGRVIDQTWIAVTHVGEEQVGFVDYGRTPPRFPNLALVGLGYTLSLANFEVRPQRNTAVGRTGLQDPHGLARVAQFLPVGLRKRRSAKVPRSRWTDRTD